MAGLRKKNGKFIPAVTGDNIHEAGRLKQETSDLNKDLISLRMPAGVVDRLESVQIHHNQGKVAVIPSGPFKFAFTGVQKIPMIKKTGQAVTFGEFLQLIFPLQSLRPLAMFLDQITNDIEERNRLQLLLKEKVVDAPMEGLSGNSRLPVTGEKENRDRQMPLLQIKEKMKGVSRWRGVVRQYQIKRLFRNLRETAFSCCYESKESGNLGSVKGFPNQALIVWFRIDDEDRKSLFFHFR